MSVKHSLACAAARTIPAILVCFGGYAQAEGAFSNDSPWMMGDWGGLRSELLEKGYKFDITYVGEAASNVAGGYDSHTTGRYADQLAFGVNVDLEKVLGWSDAELQFSVSERNGQNITNERIGDPRVGAFTSVQEVYGRGQTWRLSQLWYQQRFWDDRLNIKLGLVGVGEDFGTWGCRFQNVSFCGAPAGNWAGDTIYNYPVSQWGARVKFGLADDTYFQVGVYEQNPSYLETGNGFKMSGSGNKGSLVPVEVVHSLTLGEQKLPGEYRVGGYYSNRSWDDVYELENGQPKERNRKYGTWLLGKQQVYKDSSFSARGLTLFASATFHDKETSAIERSVQAGLIYTAPFDSRPYDEINFGVANIHANKRLRNTADRANALNGAVDYNDPNFTPLQNAETNFEINYGFAVTRWLVVRPNLQVVVDPGGVDEVDTAWVAGLKFEVTL
ncbi:carbohydrate porin [Pseudomonas kurunegalensis]|uniref:carbohydrate porin n=1 Tax=Pseudomonas kurunegalensis TaxID=485880 RepID=UPI003557688B